MQLEMIITDLDGTFLDSSSKISCRNRETVNWLAKNDIITVIATGRSLYSLNQVVPSDLPIDYVVFSSGGGIYDWAKQKLIDFKNLSPEFAKQSAMEFHNREIDYFIHSPIPGNHIFDYYIFDKSGETDSWQRINNYREFANRIDNISDYRFANACQVIGIAQDDLQTYNSIKNALPFLNVIRTTSPLDKKSLWIEVLPQNVSKASACQKLCQKLNIPVAKTIGLGNDHNDVDLLNWVGEPFLVGNSAPDLQNQYNVIDSNDNNAFSKLVKAKFEGQL